MARDEPVILAVKRQRCEESEAGQQSEAVET